MTLLEQAQERLRTDTVFWAEHCATILDQRKQAVQLRARPWQVSFDQALERQRAAGQPMRALILKARKLGFSTWVQAKFMQRITQMPFQYALVAAQDRKTAGVLADMATLIYERLPTDEQLAVALFGPGTHHKAPFSVRPELIGVNSNRAGGRYMILGDRRRAHEGSVYETITAAAKASGRGYTPSMFHGSEVAHWEDSEVLVGLLNSIPDEPETIAVLESTANGFNHFEERWQRAVSGEAEEFGGLYAPLFYGWQDNPFNSLPFATDMQRDRFVRTIGDEDGGGDDEEPWLVDTFAVSPEQLYWRRLTRDDKCDGKVEIFHQEHPATPEQAFIGSGNPVFAAVRVARAIKSAEASHEPVEGVLAGSKWQTRRTRAGTVDVPHAALWVPASDVGPKEYDLWGTQNRLRVWEHPVNKQTQDPANPRPEGQYVVFVDVARGKDNTSEERDWNAIQVIDHVSRMQVLSYRSRTAIHELPLLALLVARYYNDAWLAVEKTGLGVGVVDALVKDYRYPRMYRTHRSGDDQRQDAPGYTIGWETTLRTKPMLEQTMATALKEETHGLRCLLTARELTTYIEDEKGHHAQHGAFDDLLMAWMGCQRVAAELKPRAPGARKRMPRRHAYDDVTGY